MSVLRMLLDSLGFGGDGDLRTIMEVTLSLQLYIEPGGSFIEMVFRGF